MHVELIKDKRTRRKIIIISMKQQHLQIGGLTSHAIIPSETDSLVILFHGYGANGADLISLASEWTDKCPNTAFVAPDAPNTCEAGGPGFQWFSLADYSRPTMISLIGKSWVIADDYVAAALKHFNLNYDRLILSGFSQGCMMALHTGFKRQNPCAGILGYSGMLLDPSVVKKDRGFPVRLIHGTYDSVIPVQAWDEATEILQSHDIDVSGEKIDGLAHGIDMKAMVSGVEFINKTLQK